MTIRTFWTIFIKVLGIWLVLHAVTIVPQLYSTLMLSFTGTFDIGFGFNAMGFLFVTIAAYIFILRLFVFKTDWLIDKLHLDKGFREEKIDLNFQRSSVLTIATIVVGGLILVESLPDFCKQVFSFLQQKYIFRQYANSGWMIFHLVKAVVGYLIMTNSKQIVAFVEKQVPVKNES